MYCDSRSDPKLAKRSISTRKHAIKETTRHGKAVYYFRKGKGKRIRLPDPDVFGDAAFNLAYQSAMRGEKTDHTYQPRSLPSMTMEPGKTPGYVYFLKMGDKVKIGFTRRLYDRLLSLRTASPEEVEVLKVIPGTEQTERYFHHHFMPHRLKGEWFRLDGALAGFLAIKVSTDPSPPSR